MTEKFVIILLLGKRSKEKLMDATKIIRVIYL